MILIGWPGSQFGSHIWELNCSHFGWKSGLKQILKFSPMWEPTRWTQIFNFFNFFLKNQIFIWKPESSSQDLKQTCFIGSSCSSSHMGLLLLAPLVRFSLGAATLLLLLLHFSSYFYCSSCIIILLSLLPLLFFLLLLLFSLYCYYSSFNYYYSFFSHGSSSCPVVVTLLTWCCSFLLMKQLSY